MLRVNIKLRSLGFTLLALLPAILPASLGRAETSYASEQRKNAAMGHYARARSLMVEALAEFEQGRKAARPDMLIDPEEWRLSIISRTEELNRVLDPKPRVTRDGVRFQANKLLIRREKDRTPPVADGAKDSNYAGEEQRRQDQRDSRARMEIPENEPVKVIPSVDATKEKLDAERKAEKVLTFEQQTAPQAKQAEEAKPAVITKEEAVVESEVKKSEEVEQKPSKLIAEEEEIQVKSADLPKKQLIPAEDAEERAAAGAQTLEEKEDEVTREIERAIQERIKKEKADGGAVPAGEEQRED